jgi:hypothetical protein
MRRGTAPAGAARPSQETVVPRAARVTNGQPCHALKWQRFDTKPRAGQHTGTVTDSDRKALHGF